MVSPRAIRVLREQLGFPMSIKNFHVPLVKYKQFQA